MQGVAMKIHTSRFGEIEVPDDALIDFPRGVIGFRNARRFVIFDCGEQGMFK
jgi:flagellar assembly factor FliW